MEGKGTGTYLGGHVGSYNAAPLAYMTTSTRGTAATMTTTGTTGTGTTTTTSLDEWRGGECACQSRNHACLAFRYHAGDYLQRLDCHSQRRSVEAGAFTEAASTVCGEHDAFVRKKRCRGWLTGNLGHRRRRGSRWDLRNWTEVQHLRRQLRYDRRRVRLVSVVLPVESAHSAYAVYVYVMTN